MGAEFAAMGIAPTSLNRILSLWNLHERRNGPQMIMEVRQILVNDGLVERLNNNNYKLPKFSNKPNQLCRLK